MYQKNVQKCLFPGTNSFRQCACISPFHGHQSTVLLRLGVGLVPTAARPPPQRFLLHGKPPSAAHFSLILARLERASMRCCPIGDCREAVPTDGASQPSRVRARRRTCPEHWGSHFGAQGDPPAAQVSCCGQRRRQLQDVART